MDEITLKNFRCFQDEQTARLAPLTLLVGENSTGKTSFMALVRALWDVAYGHQVPDFKEGPYDLGSFDEIAHHRGARGGKASSFEAGFRVDSARPDQQRRGNVREGPILFRVTFEKSGTGPMPVRRFLDLGNNNWIEEQHYHQNRSQRIKFGTPRGAWESKDLFSGLRMPLNVDEPIIAPLYFSLRSIDASEDDREINTLFTPLDKSPPVTEEEFERFAGLVYSSHIGGFRNVRARRPYASAPVRSKPSRTYDPARSAPDPEGTYVPMYLARVYFENKSEWNRLKEGLEGFGRASGLFDEISVKPLGKRGTEPFQVQVRKGGDGLKGPPRNLIDVGYGVSQVLPVITELLRTDASQILLLQQPEVHLHPSAQAALGSLFCRIASGRRQLIVETHSDHMLDRVRMDVRDRRTSLKPEDVSILFFERSALDVRIHSLRLDKEGNVKGQPQGYRSFFMEETQRSLGL